MDISMPLHSVLLQWTYASQCALQVEGGTSYHSIVLSSYKIRILKCLDLLNDAKDRRGSGREWRSLNLAILIPWLWSLTFPSDTI